VGLVGPEKGSSFGEFVGEKEKEMIERTAKRRKKKKK
jgi:hypothetical protein